MQIAIFKSNVISYINVTLILIICIINYLKCISNFINKKFQENCIISNIVILC